MAGMHQWEVDLERQRDAVRDRQRIAELEAEVARLRDHAQGVSDQETAVANAIMLDDGCGLTIEGERVLCDDPRAMEKPDRCYCRRSAKVALSAIRTPAVQERLAPPGSPERTAELQYEAGMYESLYLAWKERAERAEAQVEEKNLHLSYCREAMRFADIDLSMILPDVANLEVRRSIRKTLDRIDEARKLSHSSTMREGK